ncbi:hypothetical protein LP7551_03282 [Roseibium album]|nr:hypothetical protein LP7551_03282 [Roseibium album]
MIFKRFLRPCFDPSTVPVLIVPTRNRPTSLDSLLHYLARFYPGARLIVADGSEEPFQSENGSNAAAISGELDLRYLAFPPEMPLLDRLETVLSGEPEGYYVLGADDDFPILETLGAAKAFLEADKDYALCGGYNMLVRMNKSHRLTTMMFDARSIEHEKASERCRTYADHDFPTYYSVASRSHILSRYDRCRDFFVPGFVDYMLGFHDLCRGKLKIFNELSYIRSANAAHSYIRVTDRLNFLREANQVLSLQRHIAADLKCSDESISGEKAQNMSEDFIFERIRFLTRDKSNPDSKMEASQLFHKSVLDESSENFRKYRNRLDYVRESLKKIVESDDNKFENRFRSTIDGR